MSAQLRTEIAAAASLVAGVTVKPYFRQTTKPGDGWVSLRRSDRDDTGFGFMDLWAVTVVLAQDIKTAEEWLDTHLDNLAASLSDVMTVTALVPAQIPMDAAQINAIVIEGTRAR